MSAKLLPLLIVVGLDYVFWPYFQDSHLQAPFSKNGSGIIDQIGHIVQSYDEVPKVLKKIEKLKAEGVKLAVMSFTSEINACLELLKHFGFEKYIDYKELSIRTTHTQLESLKNKSSVAYDDMLYFDDWNSNLKEAAEIGVLGVSGKGGITIEKFEYGLNVFKAKKLNATGSS